MISPTVVPLGLGTARRPTVVKPSLSVVGADLDDRVGAGEVVVAVDDRVGAVVRESA